MVRLIFIFTLALFIALFTMWKVEATPSVPEVGQLIRPPYVIQYQQAGQWGYFKVLPVGERSILPLGGGAVAAPKAGKTASKGVGDDVLSMNR